MAVTTYIVDKDGNQADASTVTVPANRDFRGAWSLSGDVISEDLATAKEIFKDKIREVRAFARRRRCCLYESDGG